MLAMPIAISLFLSGAPSLLPQEDPPPPPSIVLAGVDELKDPCPLPVDCQCIAAYDFSGGTPPKAIADCSE